MGSITTEELTGNIPSNTDAGGNLFHIVNIFYICFKAGKRGEWL